MTSANSKPALHVCKLNSDDSKANNTHVTKSTQALLQALKSSNKIMSKRRTREKGSKASARRDNWPDQGLMAPPKLVVPRSPKNGPAPTYKRIFLIRHGQSLGQVSPQRKTDKTLIDCGLTQKGISQAHQVQKLLPHDVQVELVVSSPLLRAVWTSACAFPAPILIHYHLCEMGSSKSIPENVPRANIQRDWEKMHGHHNAIDFDSLRPPEWPEALSRRYNQNDRIRDAFYWLAVTRPETTIAVVCHYHVIRVALRDLTLQPINGVPIECRLCTETGDLTPV